MHAESGSSKIAHVPERSETRRRGPAKRAGFAFEFSGESMFKRFVLYSLILTATATVASGATFVVPSDRLMVRQSDAVVVGSVLNTYSQLADNGAIETVTWLSVEEVIKGAVIQSTIKITEPGGAYGERASFI